MAGGLDFISGQIIYLMIKLLRIESPHFVAGCEWIKIGDSWKVNPKACAPILKWIVKMNPIQARRYLISKGWKWEWIV